VRCGAFGCREKHWPDSKTYYGQASEVRKAVGYSPIDCQSPGGSFCCNH
jgi:hypothetical protein